MIPFPGRGFAAPTTIVLPFVDYRKGLGVKSLAEDDAAIPRGSPARKWL